MFGFKKKATQHEEYEEDPAEVSYDDFEYMDDFGDDMPLCPEEFGNGAMQAVDDSLQFLNNTVTSVREFAMTCQKVKLEVAKMDHDLDIFIQQSNSNLARFQSALPVLDSKLTAISERIDHITDKMLDNAMDADSEASIQRHRQMLDMLTMANESFNNMLAKLISL